MTKKNHVFWQTDKTFDSFCSLEDQEQRMRGRQKQEINKSWKTTKLTSTTTAKQEGEKNRVCKAWRQQKKTEQTDDSRTVEMGKKWKIEEK